MFDSVERVVCGVIYLGALSLLVWGVLTSPLPPWGHSILWGWVLLKIASEVADDE